MLGQFVEISYFTLKGFISIWLNNLDPVLAQILIKEKEHSDELWVEVSIKLGKACIILFMGTSSFQSSEMVVKYWKGKTTKSARGSHQK